jgi:N utilization substance protein B
MISRRNIRVKVMQTLYTIETTPADDRDAGRRTAYNILNEKLNRALDLFVVSILYTFRTAQFAETDAHRRAQKMLPTEGDLAVSTKIAGNEYMWQTLSNATFEEKAKEPGINHLIDEEWIKKLYLQLAATNEYLTYIDAQSRNAKDEKAMMRFIWEKLIMANESLMEHFADELPGWEDDQAMIVMLMDNFFKSSSKINFLSLISAEKREYAQNLLQAVLDKKEYSLSLIQPKLNNWDAERVALVDLIILQMGVCELLYFPTIPTKVTINEYIELAKVYSTPQSGQFVNGVLDNILKDLERDDKIRKQERSPKKPN